MKRLTTATILSAIAALALGCSKGDSSAKTAPAAGERGANAGPLLPPGHGDWGMAGGGSGSAPGAVRPDGPRLERRLPDGTTVPMGARRWDDGMTPEERDARRAELREKRAADRQMIIDTFDADKDGRLSQEERGAMHVARVTEMVDRLDADQDGKLSRAELEDLPQRGRRPAPDFAAIDADKDGFVTVDEMAKSRPPGGPGRGPGGRGGWGGRGDDDGEPAAPAAPAPTGTY